VGTTTQLSATPRDARGNALAGRAVVWSSSSDAIASVSANGLVSAASPGTAQIRATSEGVTGEATVTVTPVPVATVTVSLAESFIVVGATTPATATLKDAHGNVLVGRTIVWSSANLAVASVAQTGLVIGVSAGGPVTITATSEGISGGAQVTVTPVPVSGVTVSLASSLIIGASTPATATLKDARGNVLVGRTIVWTTTNAAVASVAETGLVTGVSAGGPVMITATSEGMSGGAQVTVTPVPPVGQRAMQDRPDEVSGLQIKIVYFTSADGPDRGLDTTGVLENSVGVFQAWFAGQTGKMVRQDTYGNRLDIAYFKSVMTDPEIAARGAFVVNELYRQVAAAGFSDPNKRYLIYYDGTSTYACGGAITDGQVAAMYLKAVLSSGVRCDTQEFVASPIAPPRYWEFAMLHDSFHIAGVVDPRAPDHYAPNPYHVDNPADLMHGGPVAWHPSVVDTTGHNYYGENVPEGVRNLKYDDILIPALASLLASARLQTQSLREHPQVTIPNHVHDLVRRLP